MSEQKKYQLYFPQKLRLNKEIIVGIGQKEIYKCISFVVICMLPVMVWQSFHDNVFRSILLFLISCAMAYFLFAKIEDSNVCLADHFRFSWDYIKSPKLYMYRALNEWYFKAKE